jgi:hypothetical protein
LKDARIFTRGHVKLLDVKPHVEGGIDARRMSKAFPDALITTGGETRTLSRADHPSVRLPRRCDASTSPQDTISEEPAPSSPGFMLDQPGTFARAETAVEQFTELDAAHKHVVDLRKQADALRKVDEAITAFDLAGAEMAAISDLHEGVEPFTAGLALRLAKEAAGPHAPRWRAPRAT